MSRLVFSFELDQKKLSKQPIGVGIKRLVKQSVPHHPERYFLLDVMRGIAALTVLIWHYQHFFMTSPGVLPASFSRSEQPLYWLLFPFYNHGNYAVQLFFSISGFIFFSEYLTPIAKGAVSAWSFFVLRFSRIYPLHFVTLLVVSILQCIAYHRLGRTIVYENNDAYHFILNVFLASHWVWRMAFLLMRQSGPSR